MNPVTRLRDRLRRDILKWLYVRAIHDVLETPSVKPGGLPFTLLSMVQPSDIGSYLVAVKSFVRVARPQRIVVVCDPRIGAADRHVLRTHIPHADLRDAAEFVDCALPRGGTWERLLAISSYAVDDYVIQLDADTVTLAPLDEVTAALTQRRGFVLGETANQSLSTVAESARIAAKFITDTGSGHVIDAAEAALLAAGSDPDARYVRGCSGFTGFPPDAGMRDRLLDFSARMRRCVGPRWADWGTEQVASNYLVANSRTPTVLPFPQYGTPDVANQSTVFCHFIGSMRFTDRQFERVSREMVRKLRSEAG